MRSRGLGVLVLTFALPVHARAPILVDVHDYPPYADALFVELRKAGLEGLHAIPGLSVLDEGVRVMPVKLQVAGQLPQIAALVTGLGRDFPFATRIDSLQLGLAPAGAQPFRIELMILSPVRTDQGQPDGADLVARIGSDTRHGEAVMRLLSGLVTDPEGARWLRSLRLDGTEVTIEGESADEKRAASTVKSLLSLHGFVMSEVVGPQRDPRSDRVLFAASGFLDLARPAGTSKAPILARP